MISNSNEVHAGSLTQHVKYLRMNTVNLYYFFEYFTAHKICDRELVFFPIVISNYNIDKVMCRVRTHSNMRYICYCNHARGCVRKHNNCECSTVILFGENKDCQTYFAARRVVFKNHVIVHDLCTPPEITSRIKLDRRPGFI